MIPERLIARKDEPLTEPAGAPPRFDAPRDLLGAARPLPENANTACLGIRNLPRCIVTPEAARHRVFVFAPPPVAADGQFIVIARADDLTFGLLNSRFHELWSRYFGASSGERPRYTSATFETFPFPAHMTPRDTASRPGQASPPCMAGEVLAGNVAAAARHLDELREHWLNPPEWVDWVITPEEARAGFSKRPVARPGHEANLKKRTLTGLYNARLAGRAAWLDLAHKSLDTAVAAAYGWVDYTPDMPDEEILERLLALNLKRSGAAR